MSIFALYLLASWSVIGFLASGVFPGAVILVTAVALYTSLPVFVFLSRRGWAFYPSALFRVLVVRALLYAQLLLPLTAIAGLVGVLLGLPFGHALVFGRVAALAVCTAGIALLAVGYAGSRSLVVREVTVNIAALPEAFDGTRIVQLSDLHVGPQIPSRFLQRVVRTVESLKPDLIAVTGDLIDDRPEDVAVYARALGTLQASLGVYVIPGNHDVYAGWPAVERELRKTLNAYVLVNDSHVVQRGESRIAVVGTGDPAGVQRGGGGMAAPDIARAYSRVPADTVVIALAHNPALWPLLIARGAALTLSGHTHWGQFAWRARNWSLASRFLKYAMGAYREGSSMLYISPGTGYWGIPFRIGALPEVTLVTLRRGSAPDISMHASRAAISI